MMYSILHILDLDTLVFAVTSPVLSCCPVAFTSIALTLAGGGQGEEGSFLAHNVTPSLLTVTSITTPASVVPVGKFLSILPTNARTILSSTLITTPYTSAKITPISTQCMIDTECHHQKVENNTS